jgi:hypothetical protein
MQLVCQKRHTYKDRKSCPIWKNFEQLGKIGNYQIVSVMLNQCNNNDGYGGSNYILVKSNTEQILLKYHDRYEDDVEKSRNKCPLHMVKPYIYSGLKDCAPHEVPDQTAEFWIKKMESIEDPF